MEIRETKTCTLKKWWKCFQKKKHTKKPVNTKKSGIKGKLLLKKWRGLQIKGTINRAHWNLRRYDTLRGLCQSEECEFMWRCCHVFNLESFPLLFLFLYYLYFATFLFCVVTVHTKYDIFWLQGGLFQSIENSMFMAVMVSFNIPRLWF